MDKKWSKHRAKAREVHKRTGEELRSSLNILKIEGFTNSFQTLSTTFLNSDLFGGLIDGATGFLNILTQIIDVGGGLPAVLATISTFMGAKGHGKRKVIVFNALSYKVA